VKPNVMEMSRTRMDAEVEKDGILMVDCWADYCQSCRDFAPVFERVAGQFLQHRFGKLDVQAESEFAESLGVEHIPTLLLFRDGVLLFRQPGYFAEDKLASIVTQAQALDMDEVRAKIAANEDQAAKAENERKA
jgi:thioredoxin